MPKRIQRSRAKGWNYKITKWRGLFLFGIIPLYVWVVNYEYSK